MKKLKIIGPFLTVLIIVFGIGYKLSHLRQNINSTLLEVSTASFIEEFKINPDTAARKYFNKNVLLDGKVTKVATNTIQIDNVIYAELIDLKENTIKEGNDIKIKGKYTKYNTTSEKVHLNQCVVIKN